MMKCRHCASPVHLSLADLGTAPPSNAYLNASDLHAPERWYPLRVLVCTECWLVQTEDFAQAHELFDSEYAYFSSYSSSWLTHARQYSEAMTARFGLNAASQVVEIASNDGYLLQNFVAAGIPALGVEPTGNTAEVALSPEAAARLAYEEKLAKALALAKDNPRMVANLIKEWMGSNEQQR